MADFPPVPSLIPHRGRFLLVDRVVSLDAEAGRIETEAQFTEDQCDGHFPGQPVVPGVLLLEGLAQTMACMVKLEGDGTEDGPTGTPMLAGFEKVRFRRPVIPPATVTYAVRLLDRRAGLTTCAGEVRVDGQRVCNARLRGIFIPDGAAH